MKKHTSYWIKDPSSNNYNLYEEISYDFGDVSELYINGVLQESKPMLELETNNIDDQIYYTVHVNGRHIYGDYNIWEKMITWTVETFGPTADDGVWTPGARWYVNNARFWFREEKDREWFLLRWQ